MLIIKRLARQKSQNMPFTVEPRITNAVVEGLNSKIKTAMKRAYGFKHVQYLRTIVYLVAGRLSFD